MRNKGTIGSIRTLLGCLPDKCNNYVYFFRGHSDKEYSLKPSIYRNAKWISNEHRIVREILMRCPQDFIGMPSSFEKLVKMQHYDLPTRLLDVTENPLVALYFACQDTSKDGELLCFKIPKSEIKYYDSDTVSMIANLPWLDQHFEIEDQYSSSPESFRNSKNLHAGKLLQAIQQENPSFREQINPKDLKRVLCVKSKMDNPRVIRQDGAFFLFGMKKLKDQLADLPKEWKFHPHDQPLIVTKSKKKDLLDQLSTFGISRAKLFPEIDKIAEYLKSDFDFNEEIFQSNEQRQIAGPRVSR
ncbi:MAG: FRG domain-containing protein [Gammaproteobacteria bacterium]|nr:FRG domain-containing protein [Gammaproteobacteria bacterium]MBU2056625.1 FRG domain-containing protein [Gammaproteobacteria bacterium]MBU2173962.1 FRG domain-containing protein [Gammaproteobacteria bacterium]MBU2247268.1 FRG domain-containing protein [Gammaproteobacteria bacterium]MBU2344926.1 FRG domain-containing protein [Gammaproteobacteria bacterium]